MKQIFTLIMTVAFVAMGTISMAQQDKAAVEILKERRAYAKEAKKYNSSRAAKDARKRAKEMTAQGWEVALDQLPLEKMLDRMYTLRAEYDDQGNPVYLLGSGRATATNYTAAGMAARMAAISQVAGQIEVEMTELIEQTVANQEISAEDATSVNEVVSTSKALISQRLAQLQKVLEVSRTLGDGKVEVQMTLTYNRVDALRQAKAVVREELLKRGHDNQALLDKLVQE